MSCQVIADRVAGVHAQSENITHVSPIVEAELVVVLVVAFAVTDARNLSRRHIGVSNGFTSREYRYGDRWEGRAFAVV